MQWTCMAIDALRYSNLLTYLIKSRSYDRERAIELSEPEDTDYYGIGGRASRFTLMLVVGLVFSTLSPCILVLCFFDAFLRRVIYGYLLVFSETRKPETGGDTWVLCLNQVQQAMIIYWALMIGVIAHHTDGSGPVLLALPSILFYGYTYWRFHTGLRWETLPFHWVCCEKYLKGAEAGKMREASQDSYMQDELREPNAAARRTGRHAPHGHSESGVTTGSSSSSAGLEEQQHLSSGRAP